MAAYPLKSLLFYSLLIAPWNAFSSETKASLCFDLAQPNTRLIRPAPLVFPETDQILGTFEEDEKTGINRAHAFARIQHPIAKILEKLLNPMTTRDAETTTISMTRSTVRGALEKQHIEVKVKPIFFLTLQWEEDWLYVIKKGKPSKPETVVISYQKTNGTSHIDHFCGNILIQRINSAVSGVFLAEEIKADRRSAEDVYRGLMGTLRTLQK